MNPKLKKIIAREGLILLGAIALSSTALFFANIILGSEFTIFNYECSYKGKVQKIDIVENFEPWKLKHSLFKKFAKDNPLVMDESDREYLKVTDYPADFIVKNLPRGYTPRGFLKRAAFNFGLAVIFIYFF